MFFLKKVKEQIEIVRRVPQQTFLAEPARQKGFAQAQDGGIYAGFTLVELMVTIAIFVFMTALVVANYGSFNDGALLTSMAYDVALTLNTAQSYGINTKGISTTTATQVFSYPYGMDFNLTAPNQLIFFADSNGDGVCNSSSGGPCTSGQTTGDSIITTYTIDRGGLIKSFCVGTGPGSSCTSYTSGYIDVSFKRPDPNAIITTNGVIGTRYPYAEIQVEDASKTSYRTIVVRETGEIAVEGQ